MHISGELQAWEMREHLITEMNYTIAILLFSWDVPCICCKAITTAVMKGLRSFLWTVIILLLLLYAVGVFITQSVTDFKISLRPWHQQVSLVVVVVVVT